MTSDPYAVVVKERLESYQIGLSREPERLATLPDHVSETVLRYLLDVACRAQHAGNIAAGRSFLLSVPRDWLVQRIEGVAETAINFDDEWEYRRLLELYQGLDPTLVRRAAQRGTLSAREEIREAARDFVGQ